MACLSYNITVIKGDGIGGDVIDAAIAVIEAAMRNVGGFSLSFKEIYAGAAYFKETGKDIESDGENQSGQSDAIFLGAIGLPSIRNNDGTEISPHLRLREKYQLYAGIRPIKAYPNIPQKLANPRASEIDLVILRESTEGLFYSAAVHNRSQIIDNIEVRDILRVTRRTTEKLHKFAFKIALKRKSKGKTGCVTCVDKANVFKSMAFFRKIFDEIKTTYPDIETGYNYVDAQALDFIRKPWEFDVLVTENMFGDILSDLAGGLVGGMGIASCAEIGDTIGLFQPAHGSAPDIMGQNKANPLAAILSGALMLEYLADKSGNQNLAVAAQLIEDSVYQGFKQNRLRPIEFSGDMGTIEITKELITVVDERNTSQISVGV